MTRRIALALSLVFAVASVTLAQDFPPLGGPQYIPIVQVAPVIPPTPAPTSVPTPVPTAAPTPVPPAFCGGTVAIRSSSSYVRSTTRYVVGEICNGRSSPTYNVRISARFYDGANQLVAVADGYAWLTRTNPGELAPFKLLLSNAPASIVRYDLSLTWQNSGGLDYRPLTILSQFERDNFGVGVNQELLCVASFL